MVASVSAGGGGGGTAYGTLNLARPLAYKYQRATVQAAGNVVAAHQGATISQVLGSGQPGAGAAELHALERAAAGRPGLDGARL